QARSGNGDDPAGWPRRPRRSIPLLPSGPGGVFDLASRGADGATIETCARITTREKLAERGTAGAVANGTQSLSTCEDFSTRFSDLATCRGQHTPTTPKDSKHQMAYWMAYQKQGAEAGYGVDHGC